MKSHKLHRKELLKSLLLLPFLGYSTAKAGIKRTQYSINKKPPRRFKLSLNAYSFNASLSNGSMNLDELLEYCSLTGFDAVDLTGYYFPGYPQTPSDDYLFHIKQKAFLLGLDISGTGVRNDFTNPDKLKREADVQLVKKWIEVAAKLGAPVIRIFSGTYQQENFSREEVTTWMVEDIKSCVEHGKKSGVMVALQNHYDFIKTAEETKDIIKKVDSPWFGLILDIGSYRSTDPYREIREMAPFAVSWQIKENMFVGGKAIKTDVAKIIDIVSESGYRGYLPIETLGPGEAKTKVAVFLQKVKRAMG
jgi:sugar phosphate isomerase/epimerase